MLKNFQKKLFLVKNMALFQLQQEMVSFLVAGLKMRIVKAE